jgi:benzodiazapine receptor
MALTVLGMVLILVSVLSFTVVLIHAFQRSLGTGVMVLFLPVYTIYYGFSQFEHRRKGLVLAGWLGSFVLGVVFRAVGTSAIR